MHTNLFDNLKITILNFFVSARFDTKNVCGQEIVKSLCLFGSSQICGKVLPHLLPRNIEVV